MSHNLFKSNNKQIEHMNQTSLLNIAAAAPLPVAQLKQVGFADLLGVAEKDSLVTETKGKSGKSIRYCVLSACGKKDSIKTKLGLTGSQAKATYARELSQFSARAFAAVSGAIASGKMLLHSAVVKDSGRMTFTLVPNNSVVVTAPATKADIIALLAGMSDEQKMELLASK